MGLRVLVLAGRRTGHAALEQLIRDGRHRVIAFATEDYPGLVNDGMDGEAYRLFAEKVNIPFWKTDRVHDEAFLLEMRRLAPDVGLSIGWRRLVREPLISLPPLGFINFHTSDLPRYRGFASTSWAILRGDPEIAISAHAMTSGKADEGAILLKERIPLREGMDIGALFDEIGARMPAMVSRLLDGLETGGLRPEPQTEREVLLSYPRHPSDGWIDWTLPAEAVDRLVRSVARPYPGAFTCWKMRRLVIWKGHILAHPPAFVGVPGHVIGSEDGCSVKILTGDGIYVAEEVELDDGQGPFAPAEKIKGMQQRFGMTAGALFEALIAGGRGEQA